MNLKRKILSLPFFLIFLLFILLAALLYQVQLSLELIGSNLISKSSAEVQLSDSKINISFAIKDKDKQRFEQFLNNAKITPKVYQGVSIEVEQKNLDTLSKILPVNLNLDIDKNIIKFNNRSLPIMHSSLPQDSIQIATQTGKLVFKGGSERDFYLQITDPAVVINYATASGQLQLSPVLLSIFPSLEKIDTMEIRVSNGNISGEVRLKQ